MPELPEVETICRGLAHALKGVRIIRVEQNRPDLRFPFPENLATRLAGRQITDMRRRAKYIVIDLDNGQSLLLHLGMSGQLLLSTPEAPAKKHDHVIFHCESGRSLRFNDPRRFGSLDLCPTSDLPEHRLLSRLGTEPLDEDLTADYLTKKLRGKKTSIKVALLDQRIIAGLGNIYVCEALFYAGISPSRQAESLTAAEILALIPAIRNVLNAALKAGGSSLRDYVQSDGAQGGFQHQFAVYNRENKPCPGCTCGKSAIERIVQAGRSTFYCSIKQR